MRSPPHVPPFDAATLALISTFGETADQAVPHFGANRVAWAFLMAALSVGQSLTGRQAEAFAWALSNGDKAMGVAGIITSQHAAGTA